MNEEQLNHLTEQVIGAAIEVHRELGAGFLESTYERAMCVELKLRGIQHQAQVPCVLKYKGIDIGEGKLDLLVEEVLVVELKAIKDLSEAHKTQVLSYLKATELPLGLLINFHSPLLKHGVRRIILDKQG